MKKLLNTLFLFYVIIISGSCKKEFDYGKIVNAVETNSFDNVGQTSVNVSGNVKTDNGARLSSRGICYSVNDNPTISDQKKLSNTATIGNFSCTINGLSASTTYYARAFATNSYGTAYGKSVKFTTLQATLPVISSTTSATSVTISTALSGGVITSDGASTITSRGVCYSNVVSSPTITGPKTINGNGIGTFTSSLTGLSASTRYYIRAYATNAVGTAYGDIKTFQTSAPTAPVGVTTSSVSGITQTTVNAGGSVAGDGGAAITSRGVCWSSTTTIPTIANSSFVNNGSGIGSFSSTLSTLSPGTTYYVRAYATNSAGTSYGNTVSFRTVAATPPTGIITTSASSITQTTANTGGTVAGDGGAAITSKGVCWSSTTTIPTIANSSFVNNGSGIGSFSSTLTTLLPGTTYYLRAYATNSAGTSYGNTVSFRTVAATPPTGIITTSASSITQTTANTGGSAAGDGGAAITSRGVCWSSTTTIPTIANSSFANNGSGIGSFSITLSTLSPVTTYYVRAYATNSVGTSYGNTVSFTTLNITVGQTYQGGIVAYLFIPGDNGYVSGQIHGLIASTANISTGVYWGCSGTNISGTSTILGTGMANTLAIVNVCPSATTAAPLCNNLISGGYSDWYLPSINELSKLYLNRASIGGFVNTLYWSSSQASSITAWAYNFNTGAATSTSSKNSLYYVRAIRKF